MIIFKESLVKLATYEISECPTSVDQIFGLLS